MIDESELFALETELDKLKISIAVHEAAAQRLFIRTGRKPSDGRLEPMRSRLVAVERRIAKSKFGPLRSI